MSQHKGMKLLDFFMLGFGSMIGVGWCVAVNGWFATAGGPLPTLIAFALGVVLLIPIGFCYAELTAAMPVAGGVVAFAYKAFGTRGSFIGGWFVALAYVSILPWEAIYIDEILSLVFPALASGTPLYSVAGVPVYLPGLMGGIAMSLGLVALNMRGAQIAGKAQTFFTIVLLITGIIVIVFAFMNFHTINLQPLYQNIGVGKHHSLLSGILAMVVVVPFFMAGFDTIPQAAEEGEKRMSYKTLAMILVGSIAAAGGFYCLIILSTGAAMPWQEFSRMHRPAISLLFRQIYPGRVGTFLYVVSLVGAFAGLLTTWNGLFIAAARLLLGMGRARMLPEFFARQHPKYGTPIGANLFCGAATLLGPFVGMGIIDPLTTVGSVAFVIGWFITSLSAAKLRAAEPAMARPFRVPGGLGSILFAIAVAGAVIVVSFVPSLPSYMGRLGLMLFAGWSFLGLCFFALSRGYRSQISEAERTEHLFHGRRSDSKG